MNNITRWNSVYNPVVIDNHGIVHINETDDFDSIFVDLAERFITSNSPRLFSECQRQEDIIKEIYYSIAENSILVPELQEVVAAVEEYNKDIITKIAEVDFANNMAYKFGTIDMYEFNRIMNDLCESWRNDLYFEYFEDLESWVQELLDNTRNAYIITGARYYNYWPTNEYLMIKNDAQNLINPEWILGGMDGYINQGLVDLNKVQVVSYI